MERFRRRGFAEPGFAGDPRNRAGQFPYHHRGWKGPPRNRVRPGASSWCL
jgi:hypothetical protein